MNSVLPQPVRFVLVGTGGYVLNACAFTVLFFLGTQYVVASVSAYLLSNGAMYLGNRYFTFELAHDGFMAAYVRYAAVGAVVAALTAVLLTLLVEGLGTDPLVGQALALTALVPLSFLLSKRWAFRLSPVSRAISCR